MQNFIEFSAADHELMCVQRKKNSSKTMQPIATARTVNINYQKHMNIETLETQLDTIKMTKRLICTKHKT